MALSYSFILNGQTLDATIGAVVYDKLEEAMDEAALNIPITILNIPHSIFGLLEITAKDSVAEKKFSYIIISDTVTLSSKEGFYEHSLMAIEYTHKLDKNFVSALTFTKPFLKTNRAPFEFLRNPDIVISSTSYSELSAELFPKVEFKENYFVNEVLKVTQVGQALVAREGLTNTLEDVQIRTNINSLKNMEIYNLTNGDLEITLRDDFGDYEIEVGYIESEVFIAVYRHYIRLIEDRRYTMYDMLNRVRAAIPIERESVFENTRLFDIDANLVDYFKTIDMPQMFFSQQSARQVINTMFKYINAISRLNHDYDNQDSLGVDFFNKIAGSFDSDDIVSVETQQDAENYGTRAITFLNQTLQSNFRDNPSIKTPANGLFKTVRASNVQLTDNAFEIKLERPIYEINKVVVKFPRVAVEFRGYTSGLVRLNPEEFLFSKDEFELDITSRLIEKSFWDLKNNTNDILTYENLKIFSSDVGLRLNKAANIFWEKNSNRINFSLLIGSIFKENLLEEMLRDAIHEEFTLGPYDPDKFGGFDFPDQTINERELIAFGAYEVNFARVDGTDIGTKILSDNIFRNLSFNIEYTTLDETVIRQERMHTNDVLYETELRMNQVTAVSDYGRVSRDLFGKIERSGLANKTITKIHENISSVLDVGQIDSQGFIIVERKLIFHNDFIEAIYSLNKNHNRLNEFNGINQEFRIFEIPNYSQIVKRLDFYSDNIYIVNPAQRARIPIDETDTTIFNFEQKFKIPFAHLTDSQYDIVNKKISYAFIRTDGFLQQYPDAPNQFGTTQYKAVMTPVISFGGKNNLNFNFKFDSNIVAGDALTRGDDTLLGLVKNFYNKPIPYTDSFGFFDKMWFGMGARYTPTGTFPNVTPDNEPGFNAGYAYPLVTGNEETLNQDFFVKNQDFTNPDWFIVYKDAATTYGFSYQLNFLPLESDEFVIGHSFFLQNPLVMDYEEKIPKKLFIYEDGTEYNKFDDLKIKTGYETSIDIVEGVIVPNPSDFTFLFAQTVLDQMNNATSWAIGDEEGNLFLACNKNYSGFGLLARHKKQNLYQIGDKIFSQSVSISDPIKSNILFEAVVQTMRIGVITDGIISDIEFNADISLAYERALTIPIGSNITGDFRASVNFEKSMFELLDSRIDAGGISQINYDRIIDNEINSEIEHIAISQLLYERDITASPINSDITFEGFSQNFGDASPNENLQSNIAINVVVQIPQNRSFQLDGSNSNIEVQGIAQFGYSDSLDIDINSNIVSLGIVTNLFESQQITKTIRSDIFFNGYSAIPRSGILSGDIASDMEFEGDRAYSVVAKTLGTDSVPISTSFNFSDENLFYINLNASTFTTVRTGKNGLQFEAIAPNQVSNETKIYTFSRWDELNTEVGATTNDITLTVSEDLSLVATYTSQTKVWSFIDNSSSGSAYGWVVSGTYFYPQSQCPFIYPSGQTYVNSNISTSTRSVGDILRLEVKNDAGGFCTYEYYQVVLT